MQSATQPLDSPAGGFSMDDFLTLLCHLGVHGAGTRAARAYFDDLFKDIDLRGKRVLDIGGGGGMHSFYAALNGAREVICLEPDAAGSISSSRREFESLQQAMPALPVELRADTIQEFSDDQPFDVVLMCDSINHVDEQACIDLLTDDAARQRYREMFGRIAGMMVPGGTLLVTDCARENFLNNIGIRNPLCSIIEWEKHQQPETWAAVLEESGFSDPKIDWTPLYRLGPIRRIVANRTAAYFLKSMFRLQMRRRALNG